MEKIYGSPRKRLLSLVLAAVLLLSILPVAAFADGNVETVLAANEITPDDTTASVTITGLLDAEDVDVALKSVNRNSVVLEWDTVPNAVSYDVRYSTSEITADNFEDSAEALDYKIKAVAHGIGTKQKFQVNNLVTGTTYYFAVKAVYGDYKSAGVGVTDTGTPKKITKTRTVTINSGDDLKNKIESAIAGKADDEELIIEIAAGTYTINTTIYINGRDNITIKGATGKREDVVIRGGAAMNDSAIWIAFKVNDASYVTFQDLSIINTRYHAFQLLSNSHYFHADNLKTWDNGESGFKVTSGATEGGGEIGFTTNDYGLIENCLIGFTSNAYNNDAVEGVDIIGGKGWVIRDNVVENVKKDGTYLGYGIFAKAGSVDTIIERNLLKNCFIALSFGGGGSGAFFRGGDYSYEHKGGIIRNNVVIDSHDSGITLRSSYDFKVYNNTVFSEADWASIDFKDSLQKTNGGQPNRNGWVYNNILSYYDAITHDYLAWEGSENPAEQDINAWGNRVDLATVDVKDNLYINEYVTSYLTWDYTKEETIYNVYDLFVDFDNDNFHLKSTATDAIGKGKNLTVDVPDDKDGLARTALYDIGAYKYVTGPAPTGTITVKTKPFAAFINTISFGQFFKDTVNVGIEAQNANAIEYLYSETALTDTTNWSAQTWTVYTGEFSLPKGKWVVYARLIGSDGMTVISSDGVVIYQDSAQSTASISFTKGSNAGVTATVTLNGNTIAKINDGSKDLKLNTDYSVSGGTITFKSSYLDSLTAGNYTLRVHYNPQGVEYPASPLPDSVAPATTTIALTVTAATKTYTVTVSGSYASANGGGNYAPGATVTISAGSRSNYRFNGWTASGVTLAKPNSATTTFTMPSNNVSVKAKWSYNGGGQGGNENTGNAAGNENGQGHNQN